MSKPIKKAGCLAYYYKTLYLALLVVFLAGMSIGATAKKLKVEYDAKNSKNLVYKKVKDPKWQTMHDKGDYTEIYRAYVPQGWVFIIRQDGKLFNSIVIKDPEHKWL